MSTDCAYACARDVSGCGHHGSRGCGRSRCCIDVCRSDDVDLGRAGRLFFAHGWCARASNSRWSVRGGRSGGTIEGSSVQGRRDSTVRASHGRSCRRTCHSTSPSTKSITRSSTRHNLLSDHRSKLLNRACMWHSYRNRALCTLMTAGTVLDSRHHRHAWAEHRHCSM